MKIKEEKLNDFNVVPIPGVKSIEKRKNDLNLETPYPNIFLLAKKGSGKTTCIYHLLDKLADKNSIVLIFCGTVYMDSNYKAIIKMLKNKKIDYIVETSFKDKEGNNQLSRLINALKKNNNDEWQDLDPFMEDDEDIIELPKHDHDTIIVIDDISSETKHAKELIELLKNNRHPKITMIMSSQNKNDIQPESWSQMQYVLLFDKIPSDKNNSKLEQLHKDLSLPLEFKDFKELYKRTSVDKNFLFIDVDNKLFRKNFNTLLNIQ